jgi:RNA polymerase sigma factor (TIGR02999 family)
MSELYQQLQLIAHNRLGPFDSGSLNTSGLVHEAYLKLAVSAQVQVQSPQHFKAIAATVMRQIIIDRARQKQTQKQGGKIQFATLHESKAPWDDRSDEALFIGGLVTQLKDINDKLATTVECRYFAGYSEKETALILGVDVRTVRRYWDRARKWLEQAYEHQAQPAI